MLPVGLILAWFRVYQFSKTFSIENFKGVPLYRFNMVRAWRDAKVATIFAGTNESMKGIVAKFMGM